MNNFRKLILCLALAPLLSAGSSCDNAGTTVPIADAIFVNATFVTMNDGGGPTAEAVAVTGSSITDIGSELEVRGSSQGPNTQIVDLAGATVFPGFIDTHSHLFGYAIFNDPQNWIDVSNENFYFKPLPGDPRCTDPTDPQVCFIPVQSEDDVLARLTAAVAAAPSPTAPILAFGHDVARLGPTPSCPSPNYGFACPNLQDGNGRAMLDAISTTHPIFISAASGHFSYVNTPALTLLNICGTDVESANCHQPVSNAASESAQANTGVLVEDLAFYSTGFFEGPILQADSQKGVDLLLKGVEIYQQHGFTTVQEGAAGQVQLELYEKLTTSPQFPVTVVVLPYAGTANIQDSINLANQAQAAHANDPSFIVGGIKTFADGSTQGYTASLIDEYSNVYPPLMQPWFGNADFTGAELEQQAAAAHAAGFPMAIHMNGDRAIDAALAALSSSHTDGIQDLPIHVSLSDPADFNLIKDLGLVPTFLIPDTYYYGLLFCQQIIGPTRAAGFDPVAEAVKAGLPFGLHSDSPVTPPYPLFMVWVAATRKTQQPPWIPNLNPAQCPEIIGGENAISIEQGMRAFTVDAAAFYGIESQVGSLKPGMLADMTILSANPLNMENDPDQLSTIQVLGTIHHGTHFPNPNANQAPIWPE